ncbi:MAG: glycine-rich RNA-binding protein 4, mitochondrial-like [Francisellaceae bacterium]|nr:glycine-rich RNA-binding protein 4, mitochondrial-like [Francisellaceae bacterium]
MSDTKNQLFVGNLSFQTTEEELQEAFKPFGNVTAVKLPVDRDTKRPRGFGFVTFESDAEAEKALALDGTNLNGRDIRVNIAEEKKPGGAGGSRGGFGGGNGGGSRGGYGGGSSGGRGGRDGGGQGGRGGRDSGW